MHKYTCYNQLIGLDMHAKNIWVGIIKEYTLLKLCMIKNLNKTIRFYKKGVYFFLPKCK